jgi:uncharacterized protein (UPF0548 family)
VRLNGSGIAIIKTWMGIGDPAILLAYKFPSAERRMFCLSRPNRDFIASFLSAQQKKAFSYPDVGCSRQQIPKGYVADHNRIELGTGVETFERATRAVRDWKMFDMPWIELCWPDTPIEAGASVAVVVSHLGFWSLNACRIVYVMDEHGSPERYGFAYGTLPDHGARGEERFSVECNSDGRVYYDLYAISRAGRAARLGYPYARVLQKRFARDSKTAMERAVRVGD